MVIVYGCGSYGLSMLRSKSLIQVFKIRKEIQLCGRVFVKCGLVPHKV